MVMVPPMGMAIVAVNVRVTGTKDEPTTRSEEAMNKETDDNGPIILPDDKALDDGHVLFLKLTPAEPSVGGPIVKPLMVIVTATNALMTAPKIVITTAVAEVAPHVAVNPATLLAPEPTVGTTAAAKKFAGYERIKVLPDVTSPEGEKTTVVGTDTLPETRFESAMLKLDNGIVKQCE